MPLPTCCLCLRMEHAFHSETSALLAQLPSQLRLFQLLALPCHGMSYSAYPRQTTSITLLRVERCRITDLGLLCSCILPWPDQASASVGSSTLRTLCGSCAGAESRFKSWAQEHCPPQILQQRLQALTFHLISQYKAPLRQQTAGGCAAALLLWAFHHELAASSVTPYCHKSPLVKRNPCST